MYDEKIEMVSISKADYEYLLKQSTFLDYLEIMGVDNWNGYSEAYHQMIEENPQFED